MSAHQLKAAASRGNASAGFTLIELLLTMAMVIVLAAMAIPAAHSAIASYQLSAATQYVSGVIQSTRYQAIMHGYPYQLDLNAATAACQISSEPGGTTSFSNVGGAVPISGSPIAVGTGSTGHATMQFKANGSVVIVSGQTPPMSLTISYNGTTKTITVSNYGSVTVH
jgi:type IV fimbrial biogenesis protein FimT